MNKLFYKNILNILAAVILTVSGFIIGVPQISAQTYGKYLSADVGEADLMGIASKYPTSFWTALIIFILFCLGYGAYYFIKNKKKI